MARKSIPFEVVIHYTGKKSKQEMQELYANFYIKRVKDTLDQSGLDEKNRRAILDKLIAYYDQKILETNTLKP